jgi:glycosyltransferase involved in cell wall biosynthesis
MQVIYLHQYFTSPFQASGTRSYEMARRLAAAGHEVTLMTSSANLGESWAPKPGWHSYRLEGIRLEVLQASYSNEMSFTTRIKAFIFFSLSASRHVRKFKADIVFATSSPLTIAIPALVAKFWHRIPMVFEVRDLWPELPIAVRALRNPFSRMLARLLEWFAYHASAHVVALSPGIAIGIMKRGIPASKVSVIPNSCDIELFDIPAEKGKWVRNQLGLKPGQPLIVYTGTFGLINGVGYLVDVAATMHDMAPEVRFLLVGLGAEKDKVMAKADRLGLLNKILWIWSPQPKVKVPEILAASTVATSVFIPLEPMWNNSANKFFDALAAGKPIAVNYGGWQADILRESGAGIVLPPDDIPLAARLIADFVRDPIQLAKAASAARKLAYENFNQNKLFLRLKEVLERVAG